MINSSAGSGGSFPCVVNYSRLGGAFDYDMVHAIEKRQVVFGQGADHPQSQGDVDSIVLARPEGAKASWN
jgi:hypothetical protein